MIRVFCFTFTDHYMVQIVNMQTALTMAMNIKGKENLQQHPHILKRFHSLQSDHIRPSLFTPSSSQGVWGPTLSHALNNSAARTHTQVSGGSKASPFLVVLVFRDARNLISQITSRFIFSDHSSHWLCQLQVITYINMTPVWATMKCGRWS